MDEESVKRRVRSLLEESDSETDALPSNKKRLGWKHVVLIAMGLALLLQTIALVVVLNKPRAVNLMFDPLGNVVPIDPSVTQPRHFGADAAGDDGERPEPRGKQPAVHPQLRLQF